MERWHLTGLVLALTTAVVAVVVSPLGPSVLGPLATDGEYPVGAGPNGINFTALEADDSNVSHTPREYWDAYAVDYDEPEERRYVEGDYYIDARTGEVLADRWQNVSVYRNGTTYAYVQPADSITDRQRDELEADPEFTYHNTTDAYYKYDTQYLASLETTNLGDHINVATSYTWEAVDRTTHHGVPVITYRVTGIRGDGSGVPPANGTLRLGAEDGVVYAFDLTREANGESYRYTYEVRPEPFPDHGWVETARAVAADDAGETGS